MKQYKPMNENYPIDNIGVEPKQDISMLEKITRKAAPIVAGLYLLTTAGCASLKGDYTINGVPLDNKKNPSESGQTAADAGSKEQKSWWSKNWGYVVGGILIGGAAVYIITNDDDEAPPKSHGGDI